MAVGADARSPASRAAAAGGTLLSPAQRALARRRLAECAGLLLGVMGVALLLSLLSYDPRDPSLDTATSGVAANLLGPAGAVVADLLLQGFGVAGALPGLAMLAWAWRVASRRGLRVVGLRICAVLLALPALGAALGAAAAAATGALGGAPPVAAMAARLPAWPTQAGLGGVAGRVLGEGGVAMARRAMGPAGGVGVWLGGTALAVAVALFGVGLTLGEWRGAGRGVAGAARFSARASVRPTRWAGSLLPRFGLPRLGALLPRRGMAPEPAAGGRRAPLLGGLSGRDGRGPAAGTAPNGRVAGMAGRVGTAAPGAGRPGAGGRTPPAPVVLAGHGAADDDLQDDVAAAEGALGVASPEREPPRMPAVARAPTPDRADGIGVPPPPAAEPPRIPPRPPAPVARPEGRAAPEPARMPDPRRGAVEPPPDSGEGGWRFPPLDLLRPPPARAGTGPSEDQKHDNARLLETVLSDYGVQGAITDIRPGPVVTLYELEPAPGIRSARVIGLADDVARSLSVTAVRIATVPGRNVIGIEVPNSRRETVFLSELLGTEAYLEHPSKLSLALGKDISGLPIIADLARMPHLLVAGTTGSGKSVGINAMILSLLYKLSPEQCRLILIDPKMLELSVYDGIPHLLSPVVTEPAKAVTALKWTVREMERRYRAMSQLGVRNVGGYNERVAQAQSRGEVVTRRVQTGFDPETGRPTFEEQPLALERLPFIVVVIDEMADLMMTAGKEIEAAVQRLAQMARAAGIHVIMATQRPSVDVITGTIKANFPTRISFQVISKFDSRTILGEQGAEQLLGQGDLLYMQGGGRIGRVHGPFVGDEEVEGIVAFLRSQGEPAYLEEVTEGGEEEDGGPAPAGNAGGGNGDGEKGLLDQAIDVVARHGKASTSFIQRHLGIGYNRAAKLIEQMEKEGIITPANHVGKREVLVRRTNEDE